MSSTAFQKAHAFTAKWEGGLSDHPSDPGGLTKYGVCIVFLKDFAKSESAFLKDICVKLPVTDDTIRQLTKDQAAFIFKRAFWDKVKCGDLPLRPAVLLYDMAVNHGAKTAVKLCQRGVNAVFGKGTLVEDGLMGPKTRDALSKDTLALALAIIQKRRDYYQAIVANNPSRKVFLKGWLNRANDLEKYIRGIA